jgi:hypothetical protein
MTGWDTPSRPTWDPHDGPDDGTQASPAPGRPVSNTDPWSLGSAAGRPSWDRPSWDLPLRDRSANGRNVPGAPNPVWDQDLTRQAPAWDQQDYGRPDFGRPDFGRPDFGRADFTRADYAAEQDFAPRPDQSDQGPSPAVRREQERAARMDPALRDFFGADAGYGSGTGPRTGPGAQAPARPVDPWDDSARYRSSGPQPGAGGRVSRILAVAAVVVVVLAAGAYLLLHKTSSSTAGNGAIPTVAASITALPTPTATAKAAAKSPVAGRATTNGYLLSTPSVAGGYPIGSDASFLATATTTADMIEQVAVAGKGGTVTGKPVSASYTVPDAQAIEFVGFQGAFNPKTVMANLASFGSSEKSYPAGPHGGEMACANVPARANAASGGVCVWVTATTLGVAEFFEQSGPETLTVAQPQGAKDTLALRASVETRKS